MNKQEFNEAFSCVKASDDLIRGTLALNKEKKMNYGKILRRAAACAAVLAVLLTALLWPSEENYITGPGMITVRAHELDDAGNATIESVALKEGVLFTPEYIYRTDASYREEYPFFFQIEHEFYATEQIMLEVNTNAGIFYKHLPGDTSMVGKPPIEQYLYHNYGQHFTVSADKSLYWRPDGFDYTYMKEQYGKGNTNLSQIYKSVGFSANPSYIDVIIRADDNIIGYCVIEVTMNSTEISPYAHRFSFEVIALVSFPIVNGQHQNVSSKYVQTQIQKIHLERESQS